MRFRRITPGIPREISEIEAFMKKSAIRQAAKEKEID
jgi:hypothetical protein